MGKAPAFQFYPGDWRRDTQVQMADMKTRGVWFEMLCCMWDSPERGKLEGKVSSLIRLLGCPTDTLIRALNEIYMLKIGQVSAVNGNQENVTFPLHVTDGNVLVTIINRRMFREEKDRNNTRKRVQKFREQQQKRKCNESVTPPSSSSSSSSPSKTKLFNNNSSEKKCPHKEILKLYHDLLPELPKVKIWGADLEKILKTRWREDPERQSLKWWQKYFQYIHYSDFLMGRSNNSDFQADFEWLIRPSNFRKIANGRYHRGLQHPLKGKVSDKTLKSIANLQSWMEGKDGK